MSKVGVRNTSNKWSVERIVELKVEAILAGGWKSGTKIAQLMLEWCNI